MTSKDDGVVFVVKRIIELLKEQDDVLIDVFFDLVFFQSGKCLERTKRTFNVSENDFSILVMVSIPDRFS